MQSTKSKLSHSHLLTYPGECELAGFELEVDGGSDDAHKIGPGPRVAGDVQVSVVLHGHGVFHQAVQ